MQRGKQATTKQCTQQNSKLTTHPIRENKNIDSTFNPKKKCKQGKEKTTTKEKRGREDEKR